MSTSEILFIYAVVSVAIFVAFIVVGIVEELIPYRKKRFLSFYKCFATGMFLSAFVLLIAIYYYGTDTDGVLIASHKLRSVLVAFQHTIRIYMLDGAYKELIARLSAESFGNGLLKSFYTLYLAILYLIAPIMTFGFILTFIKNMHARLKYALRMPWRSVHIFSELNAKTVALAYNLTFNRKIKMSDKREEKLKEYKNRVVNEDNAFIRSVFLFRYRCSYAVGHIVPMLRRVFAKPVIVFTDISDKNEEKNLNLIESAKKMDAILFGYDLESLNFMKRARFGKKRGTLSKGKYHFYLISENETEKLRHAENVISHYNYKNVSLYIFSDRPECKLFLESYNDSDREKMKIRVRRIDDIQSLIYHCLRENGMKLFENAAERNRDKQTKPSVISAVIVGLGRYGKEMLKALTWYCQFPGFEIEIDAFESDENIGDKLRAEYPELFDENINGVHRDGDSYCTINIHSGVEIGSESFEKELGMLKNTTYVFICLGSDEVNLNSAIEIRRTLLREGCKPDIETVVYDSNLKKKIEKNAGVNIIGDIEGFYSYNTVIDPQLSADGFAVHQRWDTTPSAENTFYMSDYNYRSSVAKALHCNLRSDISSLDRAVKEAVFPMACADGDLTDYTRFTEKDWNAFVLRETSNVKNTVFLSKLFYKMDDRMNLKLFEIFYKGLDEKQKAEFRACVKSELGEKKAKEKAIELNVEIPTSRELSTYLKTKKQAEKEKARKGKEALSAVKDDNAEPGFGENDTGMLKWYFKALGVIKDMKLPTYESLSDDEKKSVAAFAENFTENRPDKQGSEVIYTLDRAMKFAQNSARFDHIRWNAYMRSEGYVYAAIEKKNNITKQHPDIVPLKDLDFGDFIKDI